MSVVTRTSHPTAMAPARRTIGPVRGSWAVAIGTLVALTTVSVLVGAADVPLSDLVAGRLTANQWVVLLDSRLPRTAAALLAGASMALCGQIMQVLTANRFVEPTTTGTTQSAGLGLVLAMVLAPGLPVMGRMLVATLAALAGTALFLGVISLVRTRGVLMVPLVGMMLAGVIDSVAALVAMNTDLMQMLGTWMTGDLSAVIAGRYELLWIVGVPCVVAWLAADRFTIAGLGSDVTTNLGLSHARIMALGMGVVSVVSAVVVVTVGALPFLGLVVPNLVRLLLGDDTRRTVGWVACCGAAMVVGCDVLGRVLPALTNGLLGRGFHGVGEVPVGTVMGIVGGGVLLVALGRLAAPARGRA